MALRPRALAHRAIAVAPVILFGSATYTLAAPQRAAAPVAPAAARPSAPATLVVPAVAGQPYVYAKGMLQDAGLAWRLAPGSKGFAAARVVGQVPRAGRTVVNTGAPTVVLRLEASRGETGAPDQGSPYPGTRLRLAGSR